MHFRYMIAGVLGILLAGCSSLLAQAVGQQGLKAAPEGVRTNPDIVYSHKYGMALTFDLYQPKKQNGAGIIYIVSMGWYSIGMPRHRQISKGIEYLNDQQFSLINKTNYFDDFDMLLNRGFTVFEVRHGSSPKFDMPEIVGDLRRAVRFIRFHAHEYGVDPERLGLWGSSAGGHLALLLGTTAEVGIPQSTEPAFFPRVAEEYEKGSGRVAAVVAYSAPTEFTCDSAGPADPAIEFVLKQMPALAMKAEQCRAVSPIRFVSSDDPPTLFIYGEKDTSASIPSAEAMYQSMLKVGVKTNFVKIPDGGHTFSGKDKDLADTERVKWFEEHLKVK